MGVPTFRGTRCTSVNTLTLRRSSLQANQSKVRAASVLEITESLLEIEQSKRETVLSYLSTLQVATPATVAIAPVPLESTLTGDRYYLCIAQGDYAFHYGGIQFTFSEARQLYPAFAALAWQFNDDGKLDPEKLRQMDVVVHRLMGGAL